MNLKKINLPAMIISQMKNVKVVSTLTYGSLRTRLFEATSIPISGEGITSRSTQIKMLILSRLGHDVVPPKKVDASGSQVVLNAQKAHVKEVEVKVKNVKKGKGEKGKKKANNKVVMTMEKIVVDEPLPNLVQTRISVAPFRKVIAEKPSEAAEKSAKEVEDDRIAELARVVEAEKLNVGIQLAEKNKRAEAAVAAHAELDNAEAAVREQVAKAKADAIGNAAEEDAENDIPLTRRRTKASASMRKPMRKRDFILTAPELEDVIPEEEEREEE
ncbi:hypothetical protein M5689_024742 [Euphorbia peplus]|nr:hypothetical protein M5689_024742 [Euphorbia peplus]